MTKVFVGGSRHASRLSAQVRKRLDSILDKGFPIVIGDANGADKAVQQYLHSKRYLNVEVFCSDGVCRNNIGGWHTRNIAAETRERNAHFYSAKDRVMAQEATVGLMIWDGKSVGTLLNAFRLLSLQKKVVIYSVPEKRFLELRNGAEWDNFIASRDTGLRRKVEQRAKFEAAPRDQPHQTSFL
jgi:hypothetical protein